MYSNWKFPQTPDSFIKKVKQTVGENMKETVETTGNEEEKKITLYNQKEETKMSDLKQAGNNTEKKENRGRKMNGWKKKAVAAVLALTVVGVGSFTVHAVVDSLVKARMESMSKEEKTELLDEVDSQKVNAASYSRELTQEEKERERELNIAYHKEGRFPEGEIVRVEDEGEANKDMLCFNAETFTFYLPERDLTDEELLQIIDYREKVNYSLGERYEEDYADEVAARKAEKEEIEQQVEVNGGMTEEEATKEAEEWLDKVYGKSAKDMEVSCFIDNEGEAVEGPSYEIHFSYADTDFYTFAMDVSDGSLKGLNYSGKELMAEEMTAADGEAKAEDLSRTAEKYLRDTFGISGECKELYYAYNTDENNTVILNMMTFQFVMEDGHVYVVSVDCKSGILELYKVRDYESWKKSWEKDKELAEKGVLSYEIVKKQLR